MFAAATLCANVLLSAADPATLAAALSSAQGGETIAVGAGDYGDVAIKGRKFSPPITIIAADATQPPRLRSLVIDHVEGLVLEGLSVERGPANPLTDYAIHIKFSSRVRLRGLDVASAPNGIAGDDGFGVMIRDSKDVSVVEGAIHDVFRGVASLDNDDVTIAGVAFSRMGSDGVVARGALRLTIENNTFRDADLVDPVRFHPDAIQLWSRGASRANADVVIRGNSVFRGAGDATQGIFVKAPELTTRNLTIENNRIDQSMWQAIYVENADGVVIRNNRVTPAKPGDRPGIDVRGFANNVRVAGNVAASYRIAPGVAATGNRLEPPR